MSLRILADEVTKLMQAVKKEGISTKAIMDTVYDAAKEFWSSQSKDMAYSFNIGDTVSFVSGRRDGEKLYGVIESKGKVNAIVNITENRKVTAKKYRVPFTMLTKETD